VPDPAEDEKTIDARLDAIVAAQPSALAPSVPPGRGQRSLTTALIDSALAGVTHPPHTRAQWGHSYFGETGDISTLG